MSFDVPTPASPVRRGPGRLLRAALSAALGLALAASGALTAPAQAGILDPVTDPLAPILDPVTDPLAPILDPITGEPLTPPEPVIASGGAGSIELLGEVVCSSDGTVEKACGALPLGELTGVDALQLEAVPADPTYVPEWDGCPQGGGPLCEIPLPALLAETPLAPVLSFRPPALEEQTPPDTRITSAAPGSYATRHTFRFATTDNSVAKFQCRLRVTFRGAAPAGAETGDDSFVPCGSGANATRTYTDLAPGDYVFEVKATAGDPVIADPTPDTQSFRLKAPPVPQTTVVAGPRSGAWLLGDRVTYRFRSTVAGSTYACRFDGRLQGTTCNSGAWTRRAPAPGTHAFTVAARANGVSDASPARRVFHVPLDDRKLRGDKRWANTKQRGSFRGTVRATRVRGAALVTRGRLPVKRVVLVADKGRGHGTVKVYLGTRLLKKVSLRAKRAQKRSVIPIATFRGVRTGRVRVVVVSSGRPVRVDGLGVAQR